MGENSGLLSALGLHRLFAGTDQLLERRVRNLPVLTERRTGPRCDNCGFGTMHLVPEGLDNAGALRCGSPGCGHIRTRTANEPSRDAPQA